MKTIATIIGYIWVTACVIVIALCAAAQFLLDRDEKHCKIIKDEAVFLANCTDVSAEIAYLDNQIDKDD